MTATLDAPPPILDEADVRRSARGCPPLTARLEPWMRDLLADPAAVARLVPEDSPVNVHDTAAFGRNAGELQNAASAHGVELAVFFARKANKCLAYVREAGRLGIGVDVASGQELRQTLDAGVSPSRVIVTAAVKTGELIDACIAHGVTASLDNADELARFATAAQRQRRDASVALRLARFTHEGRTLPSRFGFDVGDAAAVARTLQETRLQLDGLHFHLDGYDAAQRATAAHACLDVIAALRSQDHPLTFLDIGGGVPMSHLDSPREWADFWAAVEADPGAVTVDGTRYRRGGGRSVYPYHQSPTRGRWLDGLLRTTDNAGQTVADRLQELHVELRCEPGRSMLDGCGLTLARVESRKPCPPSVNAHGGTLVGLMMNRTQCRTTSEDFLLDPVLVPCGKDRGPATAGYLTGAYCMESEFLTKRRLSFPRGVAVGDVVAFVNTAGYMMHFLESRSHQFPLAPNLIVDGDRRTPDPVDAL